MTVSSLRLTSFEVLWVLLSLVSALIFLVSYQVSQKFFDRSNSLISELCIPSNGDSAISEDMNVPSDQATHLSSGVRKSMQPYDAFLVLDVEATCREGTDFDYPNEIIELPVILMRWSRDVGTDSKLEIVDQFHTYVKPIWRPILSQFCKDLTGITQSQVDSAPTFRSALRMLKKFLEKHDLIDPQSQNRKLKFCWCTDGPFDVRDFFVKQCFISQLPMPAWMKGDVLDIRKTVRLALTPTSTGLARSRSDSDGTKRPFQKLNIPAQLGVLGLSPFEGRLHRGIDDTRNMTRIMAALGQRGIQLRPNTSINPDKRWSWMGRHGLIREDML